MQLEPSHREDITLALSEHTMQSLAKHSQGSAQIEQSIFMSCLRQPLKLLLSFEFLLACLICIGGYKQHPTFSWMFPIDGTLIFLVLTLLHGSVILVNNGLRMHASYPIALYLLFCIWMLITIFWTASLTLDPLSDFFNRVVIVNGTIFIFSLTIVARNRGRTLRFLAAGALLAIPLAVDYIINGGLDHRGVLEERNYSIIGRIVSIGFGTLFGFMVYMRILTARWIFCMIAASVLFYSSLIIGSRQNFLAMIIQIIIALGMAIYIKRRSVVIRNGLVPAGIAVVVAIVGVVILAQSGEAWTLHRLGTLARFFGGDAGADQSAQVRTRYLTEALSFWSDSWRSVFFGDGLFSFSQQFRGRYNPGTHPHNLVVAILCEFGLVGLTLFSLLVTSLLAAADLRAARASPLAVVLISLAAGAVFRALASGDLEGSFVLLVYLSLFASLRQPAVLPKPDQPAVEEASCRGPERGASPSAVPAVGIRGGLLSRRIRPGPHVIAAGEGNGTRWR